MKKQYVAPLVDTLCVDTLSVVCASPVVTLHGRDGVRGDEAESKGYSGNALWDDSADEAGAAR